MAEVRDERWQMKIPGIFSWYSIDMLGNQLRILHVSRYIYSHSTFWDRENNYKMGPWIHLIHFEIDLDQVPIYPLASKVTPNNFVYVKINGRLLKISPVFVHISLENITLLFPISIFIHFWSYIIKDFRRKY